MGPSGRPAAAQHMEKGEPSREGGRRESGGDAKFQSFSRRAGCGCCCRGLEPVPAASSEGARSPSASRPAAAPPATRSGDRRADETMARVSRAELCRAEPSRATRGAEGRGLPSCRCGTVPQRAGGEGWGKRGPAARRERGARPPPRRGHSPGAAGEAGALRSAFRLPPQRQRGGGRADAAPAPAFPQCCGCGGTTTTTGGGPVRSPRQVKND